MPDYSDTQSVRLDIWLWRARFLKTRSAASKLISKGKVRITRGGVEGARNPLRVKKPHIAVKPGDEIAFMRAQELIHVKIVDIGTRRGPAPEAQALYIAIDRAQ